MATAVGDIYAAVQIFVAELTGITLTLKHFLTLSAKYSLLVTITT